MKEFSAQEKKQVLECVENFIEYLPKGPLDAKLKQVEENLDESKCRLIFFLTLCSVCPACLLARWVTFLMLMEPPPSLLCLVWRRAFPNPFFRTPLAQRARMCDSTNLSLSLPITQYKDEDPYYYRIHSPVIIVEFDFHCGICKHNNLSHDCETQNGYGFSLRKLTLVAPLLITLTQS